MKVASISPAFAKHDNIAWFASHRHTPETNDAYQYSYLYKYEITLPSGTRSITFPDNAKIKIFAVTVANNTNENVIPLQPLYDDFTDNKPIQLRIKEYITPSLQTLKYTSQPLFDDNIDQLVSSDPRSMASYLKSLGMDTIVVKTPPSTLDYADVKSNNKVTITYYATGNSTNGKEYQNTKLDVSNIIDSQSGKLTDTVLFYNGEGRIIVDLQKNISIDKINFYLGQFRNRGSQIFSIWASTINSDVIGDPQTKGWQYVGIYGMPGTGRGSAGISGNAGASGRTAIGVTRPTNGTAGAGNNVRAVVGGTSNAGVAGRDRLVGSGRSGFGNTRGAGITSIGSSLIFDNNLKCRYLMIINDGNWHGTEYLKQLDIFEKK
jgi:alpha-mannosidase